MKEMTEKLKVTYDLSSSSYERIGKRKLGPILLMAMINRKCFALGAELIHYGLIIYIGPFLFAICHMDNYILAKDKERKAHE